MNEKSATKKEGKKRGWAFKCLRAAAIGLALFVSLQFLPAFLMQINGVDLQKQNPVAVEDEPVYRDASGKLINSADHAALTGYDQSKERRILEHARCYEVFSGDRMAQIRSGCHKYVIEQKHFPPKVKQGDWGSGKTTAQCELEVNAFWKAQTDDLIERHENHAASVWRRRNWMPELQECGNYDHVRISKVVYEPIARLQAIVKKLDEGGTATDEDRQVVMQDIRTVGTFPADDHTRTYFALSDRFLQLADGAVPPMKKAKLSLSCDELKAELSRLDLAEKADAIALGRLKNGDVISDKAKWDAIQKGRVGRLFDVKLFSDGAKAAHCE